MHNPKVSIIISVLNGAKTIDNCLNSIISQSYERYEIIVIDGGSTDGTLDYLAKYRSHIYYYVSEPDSGIYNAWNKALKIASGDWVSFLGADDEFAESNTLARLASRAHFPTFNYISGQAHLVDDSANVIRVIGKAFFSNDLRNGMKFLHPGSLHHNSLFKLNGFFDESYKIAGDFDFFLRAKNFISADYIPIIIVRMGSGGISNNNKTHSILESYRALKNINDFGHLSALRFLVIAMLKSKLNSFLIKINK